MSLLKQRILCLIPCQCSIMAVINVIIAQAHRAVPESLATNAHLMMLSPVILFLMVVFVDISVNADTALTIF